MAHTEHESLPLLIDRPRPIKTQALRDIDNEILAGLSEEDKRTVTAPGQVMESNWKLKTGIGIGFACLAIEPLFSWFLWGTTENGIKLVLQDFVTDNLSPEAKVAVHVIAGIMAMGANLPTDLQSVSFAADVENVYRQFTKTHHPDSEKSKVYLRNIIMFSSVPLSFISGALADNIPLAKSIFKHIHSKTGAWTLNAVAIAIIGFLGSSYYFLFNYWRVTNHVDEFIDVVKHGKAAFFKAVCANPLEYFEVFSEMVSNTVFRGVNFGWLVPQEAQHVFRFSEAFSNSKPMKGLSISTATETGILTAFSRTLSARDEFLNKLFPILRPEEIERAKALNLTVDGILKEFIPDLIISLVRGIGTGLLVGLSFSEQQLRLSLTIGYTSSFIAGTLSYVVRHRLNKRKHALEDLQTNHKEDFNERKAEEEAKHPSPPKPPVTLEERRYKRASKLYSGIAEHVPIHWLIIYLAIFLNIVARLARWISFYGFSKEFFGPVVHVNLSNGQHAGVTLLAGGAVTVNDAKNFGDGIRETDKNAVVSYRLLSYEDERNPATTWCGYFQQTRPVRAVRAIFRARPGSHNMETLEDVYNLASAESKSKGQNGSVNGDIESRGNGGPRPGMLNRGDEL